MSSSTRRVEKGPGRRPRSAKRRRLMELRARGWSISAAARERTSGMNWSRGDKVEDEINSRPWIVLADRAPADVFAALLTSPDQPSLRR